MTDPVPTDHPFVTTHTPRLMFATEAWREALARLDEGLGARERFLLVTGEAGTGKTALLLEASARWGNRATVAVITNPVLTRSELIEEIARRLGVEPPSGASKPQLMGCLERALGDVTARSQVPVLVIEDAHQLTAELLDELRLLVNSEAQAGRAFEIALVGLPSLESQLSAPGLASFQQRIAVHCRLEPLSHQETRHYLHHRVNATGGDGPKLFPRRVCSDIHDRARGVPRAINMLAAEALRLARTAGQGEVLPGNVRAAAEHVGTWAMQTTAAPASGREPVAPIAAKPVATAAVAAAPVATASATATPVATAPTAATPVATAPAAAAPAAAAPAAPAAPASAPKPATVVAPSIEHRAGAAPNAVATSADADAGDKDPRVSAWVSRFVGSQGPPRFGAALIGANRADLDSFDTPVEEWAEPTPPAPEYHDPPGATAPKKPMRLIVLDELPEDLPAARTPERSPHRNRGAGQVVAAGVFIMAALAVVLVVTRGQMPMPRHGVVGAGPASHVPATIAKLRSSAPRVHPVTVPSQPEPLDAGAAPAAAPKHTMTLDVGSYIDAGRARAERDQLSALTGLQSWVISSAESGVTSYHTLLGAYSTEDRASASSHILLERGVISEARVVPLPPRRVRD